MNKHLKMLIKAVAIIVFLAAMGTALLTVVYLLPQDRIISNYAASVDMLAKRQGLEPWPKDVYNYPTADITLKDVFLNNKCTIKDYYTDAIMMNIAAYVEDRNPLMKAMDNKRFEDSENLDWERPQYSMEEYASLEDKKAANPSVSYARYWHGYLVILKPLLMIFNYNQIIELNEFLQIILMIYILILIRRKLGRVCLLTFAYAWIFTCPMFISQTLQYSWIYYVLLGALIVLLNNTDKINKNSFFLIYFLVVGIMSAYMDLLTYPLITLGIPMVMAMYILTDNYIEKLKRVVLGSLFWGMGYAGMWASKWIFASVILNKNVLQEAINQASYRTGNSSDTGAKITAITALVSNFSTYSNIIFIILFLVGFAIIAVLLKKKKTCFSKEMLPFILIAIMPVVWYVLLKQHSFYHGTYTYRSISILIFAGMSMFTHNSRNEDKNGHI